jgi:hypothetical protein
MERSKNPKFVAARESLPEELRTIYDQMVASYAYYSLIHHRQEFVSYKIIADLVREGWRPALDKKVAGPSPQHTDG